jgi:CRISPR-associated endonuclease/helicase Cas3
MQTEVYFAKPVPGDQGTYEYHVDRCHQIWQRVFSSSLSKYLKQAVENSGESWELFKTRTRYAVLMHDAGKLLWVFQKRMRKLMGLADDIETERTNQPEHFRHEIWSVICMLPRCIGVYHDKFPYELFAVLGHHKPLDRSWESFRLEREEWKSWPSLSDKEIKYALTFAAQRMLDDLKSTSLENQLIHQISNTDWKKQLFVPILENFINAETVRKYGRDPQKIRHQFALAKGFLHFCDWMASAEQDVADVLELKTSQQALWNNIRTKVENEGRHYEKRPFHELCAQKDGDLLVIAPTGSGKTEAALLWALRSDCKRILFFMPTMVTSNSLYKRLSTHYFPPDACGLTHSGVETYFSLEEEMGEQRNHQELRSALLFHKAFMKPLLIGTVDQLLLTEFNVGYWTQRLFGLVGSNVIFDEIHAYDTYTLGLITESIRTIKELGGRVMLMSATMPRALREHFQHELGIQDLVVAEELMNRKRATWRYVDREIEELEDEVERLIQSGKRVAIVVNTVERAKSLYDTWASRIGDSVLCYHSQFAMIDRLDKEQQLTGSDQHRIRLLIATQAVEVSLDISFDVMFSECAPFDALVQRAGRCNRYGMIADAEMIVFPISDVAKKYVYRNKEPILQRTVDVIRNDPGKWSEWEIADKMEEVYKDIQLKDDDYEDAIQAVHTLQSFGGSFIFDNLLREEKTRLFSYVKVSIIPDCFFDNVIELCEEKRFSLIPLYEVPVGIRLYREKIHGQRIENKFDLPIYRIDYDPKIGIVSDTPDPYY